MQFGTRRGVFIDVAEEAGSPLADGELQAFEDFDRIYRWLVALMFNYVPMSGHPGGSISSGRIVASLLFDAMEYDLTDPDREDADIISYAAGHKALGLYALWALRNEIAKRDAADLLPADERLQLRIEDLLGFRRNPTTSTPLFRRHNAKPLDGHPVPSTPFVKLSTGASGVGVASSLGLAFATADYYGKNAPWVHIIEGEGGLTPGRVSEALAAAGTASLFNAVLHIDWNQASIDTNHVCRTADKAGDYVQWDPLELCYLHDWNVIHVRDGLDLQQIIAAQRRARKINNGQPTAIVYRTVKGWKYGIEGRASHGAGHKFCSGEYFGAVEGLELSVQKALPRCQSNERRCDGGKDRGVMEECYWAALEVVRDEVGQKSDMTSRLARRLRESKARLDDRGRKPREGAPDLSALWAVVDGATNNEPDDVKVAPGSKTTLREQLGKVLGHYNRASKGGIFAGAADLLGSTSVLKVGDGFDKGYWNTTSNPAARIISMGGICEDAMTGILSGLSSFGRHIGAGSSYGAFVAPLGHISARLHAIGNQARQHLGERPYRPFFLICAHAGLKTGEDGPTHADPQPLQLLQENFPPKTMVTLTPWEPQEMWPLVAAALGEKPAVIAPFVTRPAETVLDRDALGLAPASAAARGVYKLWGTGRAKGAVVLQGSGVTYAFVESALPVLQKEGVDVDVYYVASTELFDALPEAQQAEIFPEAVGQKAMGITGFTAATMHRWIRSDHGRRSTMHPFQKGGFLGSGQADMVLAEAGLDGPSQVEQIKHYLTGLS